jgi:hypothetical protein
LKHTEVKYYCDLCSKELKTSSNELMIVTVKSDSNIGWERFRVTVERHHGSHNVGKHDPAELCQACALKLLRDAAKRVESGERASAGVRKPDAEMFELPAMPVLPRKAGHPKRRHKRMK